MVTPVLNEQLAALREQVSAPYDQALLRLRFMQAQLKASAPDALVEKIEPTYATAFGMVTFEGLHDETRPIAAKIMRQSYGFDNPDEIDDCLQVGYLKLWEKLQRDPAFAAGKNRSYLANSVVFRAKRERYRHIRNAERCEGLPEERHPAGFAPHSRESRQIDRRIDLELAMGAVAELFRDDPARLMALYYATTQVTIKDMQSLGISRHTLRDHTKEAREWLKVCLHGESVPGWQR